LLLAAALSVATPVQAADRFAAQFGKSPCRLSDPVNSALPARAGDDRNPILTGFHPDASLGVAASQAVFAPSISHKVADGFVGPTFGMYAFSGQPWRAAKITELP
jgi:hypothetical protein